MSAETSAPSCLIKKHEATRDSIRSRGVLAAILLLLDAHGESLANPFNDKSPFTQVPPASHTAPPERECPMTGCHEHFSTSLALINHLLVCDKARKGSVQCGGCEENHGMTRLMSPTQLWRKVVRKRGPSHSPGLTPPSLDGPSAPKPVPTLELMGDTPSPEWIPELNAMEPRFEIDTSSELRYSSFGSANNSVFSSAFGEQSAQPSMHGSYRQTNIQEMAVVEPVLEMETPFSHPPPYQALSSATPWQGASRTWNSATGASQAPTLYEAPHEDDFNHQASASYSLQQATFWSTDSGCMTVPPKWDLQNTILQEAVPQEVMLQRADTADVAWLPKAPLTLSPESSVPELSIHEAMWPMDSSPDTQSHSRDAPPTFEMAPDYQLPEYNTDYIHDDPDQTSWQSSFTSSAGSWASSPPAAVPYSHVISPLGSGGVAQDSYASWQPCGNVGTAIHRQHVSAHTPSCQTPSELDSEPSPPPDGQPLARSNAFRSPGPLRSIGGIAVAAASSPHSLRCTASGCHFQPTGQKKNLKAHLKRHIDSKHSSERLECPIDGCTKTFQNGRQDNLSAHVRKHLSRAKRQRLLEVTTVVAADSDLADDHGTGAAVGELLCRRRGISGYGNR